MTPARRAWIVRAKPHHISRIEEFLRRGIVAVGWPDVKSLSGADAKSIRAALRKSGVTDRRELGRSVGILDTFINRIAVADLVVVPSPEDGAVFVGRVRGEYRYSPADVAGAFPHQRRVEWL